MTHSRQSSGVYLVVCNSDSVRIRTRNLLQMEKLYLSIKVVITCLSRTLKEKNKSKLKS